MKIFQILNGTCYWQTPYKTISETAGRYAPDIEFAEAPDYVFEGWGYIDGEFIKPTAPEGFEYDEKTGTFYEIGYQEMAEIRELKDNLTATDYKAIKYAEGRISEEEYAETAAQRQLWRDEINRLEEEIENKKTERD